jgi:anti-anti-sigma factor
MENNLNIRKEPHGIQQKIFLDGRLDANWAGHLDDYLNGLVREGSYRLILNMSGVEYLSSAGIRILVSQYKKVKKIGGLFVLEELSTAVSDVLKMVGMISILTDDTPEIPPIVSEESQFADINRHRFEKEFLSDEPMSLELTGNPSLSILSGYNSGDAIQIKFKGNQYALGIGAIGKDFNDCRSRYGEFIALGDAVAYKPSDGSKIPDYTVKSGRLEPEINALYSLLVGGPFSSRISFEALKAGDSLSLQELVESFEQLTGLKKFAYLVIAESGGLVGVSLSTPPVGGKVLFEFPGIRENVNFTTEPAYSRMLTVSFGIFSRGPEEPLKAFLRPVSAGSAVHTHTHTAVFPFQALPKRESSAAKMVLHLFETSIVEDVLHLINDSRDINGIGDSSFKQGIAWIGKFN